jgi:predicted transcriptional regulator/transcriptional regulator with XRE-family HTH domain
MSMAERKVFAGARLKRLRTRLGLGQSQMAAELGLSPSYLNLIERNQRPLTVQVLLKLSRAYSIDMTEFSETESAGLVDALKEVFADPLLSGEIASPGELADLADTAPNAARGMTRLHAAYREGLERLSDLSHLMAEQPEGQTDGASRSAFAGAADYFERTSPWFPALEAAAEEVSTRLAPRDDPAQAMRTHLRDILGVDVRIVPAHVMPNEQARYDRHSSRIFLSDRTPLIERPFLLARQIALLGFRELLDGLTEDAGLASPEDARICRTGFARRLAEAILAPATRLAETVRDGGFDPLRLSDRLGLRPIRVMARMAALGGAGRDWPPAFMLVVNAAGGVLLRIPGAGFPFPRFGPHCARLPIFDGMAHNHPVFTELALPGDQRFRVAAIAEEGRYAGNAAPPRRLALIGWRHDNAPVFPPEGPFLSARPIGVTCRLCERLDCGDRLTAPVTRPTGFQAHVVGPSDYEVIG